MSCGTPSLPIDARAVAELVGRSLPGLGLSVRVIEGPAPAYDLSGAPIGGARHGRALVREDCPWTPWSTCLPCALTIGAFDGVHLGHQLIVSSCVEWAREHRCRSAAVLFDPDPSAVLRPQAAEPQLMDVSARAAALMALGLDAAVVLPFDEDVAAMPYGEFVGGTLRHIAPILSLHVGRDFRLGRDGAGDVSALTTLGMEHQMEVHGMDLLDVDGPVTSTRIRALVSVGDVRGASALLGRCHVVSGTVVHGRGEGTSLGFPTANVAPPAGACMPADGVYACYVRHGGQAWPAAVNVGVPRSFDLPEGTPARLMEAHLLGFSGDLYGRAVDVVFVEWLRAPREFANVGQLESVVGENIAWVRANLGGCGLEVGA